jgi:hypothetical protein
MPDPALCTESANENYFFGTFSLFLQPSGGAEFDVGNIDAGGFLHTPNILEHRRGTDNSLDAVFVLGRDYTINFTADEITSINLATLLNEIQANIAGGCKIPLTGGRCVTTYGARLLAAFPCGTKTIEITFWRAFVLGEFELAFTREGFAQLPGTIRSAACDTSHPAEPYGQIIISGAVCAS